MNNPTIRITNKNAQETRVHHFVTDASSLGLPPGVFPALIESDLGNGLDFERIRPQRVGEQLLAVHYRQIFGALTLCVFND